MKCNFCFICLKHLEGVEGNHRRGKNKREELLNANSIKFLVKYLLSDNNCGGDDGGNNGVLLKTVLTLCGGGEEEGEEGVGGRIGGLTAKKCCFRTCDSCEVASEHILKLHLELERLKQEIEEGVKSVRETVIRSSGWLGGRCGGQEEQEAGEDGSGLEAFQNFSMRFLSGDCSPKMKELFDVLKAFQTVVCKEDKHPDADDEEPLFYLENDPGPGVHLSPGPGSNSSSEEIVKAEPLLDGALEEGFLQDPLLRSPNNQFDYIGDDMLDYHAVMEPPPPEEEDVKREFIGANFPSCGDPPPAPIIKTKKVYKKRLPKVKLEDLEDLPPRSRRTSAVVARTRLKENRKLSKEERDLQKEIEKAKKVKMEVTPGVVLPPVPGPAPKKKVKPKPKPKKPTKPRKPNPNVDPLKPKKFYAKKGSRLDQVCQVCAFRTRNIPRYEHHLRQHETEEKAFYCDKCGKGFTLQQHFALHQDQHGGYRKSMCDVCKKMITTLELEEHLKTLHQVDTVFPCPNCSHCSSSVENSILHLRDKHRVKDGGGKELKCEFCGKQFPSRRRLQDHLYEVHKAINQFKCDFDGCHRVFFEVKALTMHKISHTDRFTCKVCFRGFTSATNLESHERVHTGEKPPPGRFKCDQCLETFTFSTGLKEHAIRMHGAEKFKCKECDKEYLCLSGLDSHMAMKHDGNAKYCPICNKKCTSRYTLRLHMDEHNVGKHYICEECGSSFRTINRFKFHKKIHQEKKHRCAYCPKLFAHRKYLLEHQRIHTGLKAFACDICGKAFNQRAARYTHRKNCQLKSANPPENANDSVPVIPVPTPISVVDPTFLNLNPHNG